MRFFGIGLALALTLAVACAVRAQTAAASPPAIGPQRSPQAALMERQRAALGRLDPMVGSWAGSGWIATGPGQRREFTQTEQVERKLDGTLITIQGEGRDKTDPAKVVHSAFAILTYDPGKQQYRYLAFSGGRSLDVVPEITAKGWRWGFDTPAGRIRNTLDFSAGEWREFGEISRDSGQTWHKNFDMVLKRK